MTSLERAALFLLAFGLIVAGLTNVSQRQEIEALTARVAVLEARAQ